MKVYEKPELEEIEFQTMDIITTSGDDFGVGGEGNLDFG